MEHYLAQSDAYRSTWPEPDVTLELLRKAVFAFFGVKESHPELLDEQMRRVANPQDGQAASMTSGVKMTLEEADAYIAAGMPSPFTGWLEGHRNERRRRESTSSSGPEEV
ncbi:MAG TPA: hypothetical protein VMW24_13485 [Sedimentisphaerales bacterium]|nr:hypothetical protein [Sedimentisphaerales bacterium]